MPVSVRERNPHLDAKELLGTLVPPPVFADVRFDNFQPDDRYPSQAEAVTALRVFSEQMTDGPQTKRFRIRRAQPPETRPGVYLDGGFGVGKTHLLASLWHDAPAPKAFGTFVEFTNLVGVLGFEGCVSALSSQVLVCIDEFELDDPGDTVLMSSLLAELVSHGVRLAATSNTLPDRLGEGRFAAEDFMREIQRLRGHFDVLRIDGEDYRHRELAQPPAPVADGALAAELTAAVARFGDGAVSFDVFNDLMAHLQEVHPSRFGALVADLSCMVLSNLDTLTDQAAALRLVVLVDRLYDRGVRVVASGVPVDQVFGQAMLAGGYRKKYFRAISRLTYLARRS